MDHQIASRSLTRYELDILFRNILNQDQIKYISLLCKLLGRYMILDREMINTRAGEKIGLSYIKRAIENGLITELQYQDGKGKKPEYYFQLNTAGVAFLESIEYRANILRLDTDQAARERILSFNRYAIDEGYEINLYYPVGFKYNYFFCNSSRTKKCVVCYFENKISEQKLIEILYKMLFEKEQEPKPIEIVNETFDFEKIHPKVLYNIGNKTAGNSYSSISDLNY